jgi:anti-sigma B factor antagonist
MEPSEYKQIRVRYKLDVAIVGFITPYLQTEEDVNKATAELFDLVENHEVLKMILSFDGVRFVSSSMLAQVIRLHKTLAKAKGKLRLCALANPVRDVLRASQLDKMLDVQTDEAAALVKF